MRRCITLELLGVTLAEALDSVASRAGLRLAYSPDLVASTALVDVRAHNDDALSLLARLLAGQQLRLLDGRNGIVVVAPALVRTRITPIVAEGTIRGRLTDRETGAPLAGAMVWIEGTRVGAIAEEDGRFAIPRVPVGSQTLLSRRIGYQDVRAEVEVRPAGTAIANLELSEAAVALDEVVVTGSMVETKVRELPSPITTVSSRDIERQAIQRPDQLFRGTIPGAITFESGPYNYYSSITMRGRNSLFFDYIKTYIDGVETANPLYIATIDPASIERVEVIRGPQASTIYGSDASGGVLQIFTKKGRATTRPTLRVQSAMGFIDNIWGVEEMPLQHDVKLSVYGGGEEYSYNVGGSYFHYDEFVPEAYTDDYSLHGSMRVQHGPLTGQLTSRYYLKSFGWPLNPMLRDLGYSMWQAPRYEQNYVRQKMIGLNLAYAPAPNWTHRLVLGHDANSYEYFNTRPRLRDSEDTLYTVAYAPAEKTSLRYHSAVEFTPGHTVRTTLTVGVDHSVFSQGGFFTTAADTSWGAIGVEHGDARLSHTRYANTGYFIQSQTALAGRLFLTGGVRVEVNDNFGADRRAAVAPRGGLAYAFEALGAEWKARAAAGSGIKAPLPTHKAGFVNGEARYEPNPGIGPEEIRGWDAGVEVAFPRLGSLEITYYDQHAIDLIEGVALDLENRIYQYQNVGEISNRGWEIEGELFLEPFSVRGTFTTMNSVLVERAPEYNGDVQIGESMMEVPEWSGGVTGTYSHPRGSISLSTTYLGPWVNYDWTALYGYYYGGHGYRGSLRDYQVTYGPVAKLNLRSDYALTERLEAYVTVSNLTNETGERSNVNTDMPRATMFGFRYTH